VKKLSLFPVLVLLLACTLALAFFIHQKTDTYETISYNGKTYKLESLSQETIDWLKWYNELPDNLKGTISYIPSELIDYDDSDISIISETK
jgi:hypothetical protein